MALSRLFGGDDDFFRDPIGSILLDPRSIHPSLLTSNWQNTVPNAKHIALDVIEKPEAFEVKGDLPGVKEEEVKLSVDGDVLSLSVENQPKESRETKEEAGMKIHRVERSSSFVRRAIRLPESADTDNIEAAMHDGVLSVHIPKREKASRQKRIQIGKGNGAGKTISDENTPAEETHAEQK